MTTGYTYDEFGNLARIGAQDFLNEVTFTGSVSDTASGLQYMNARFYNPDTGRFLSQDTYSGSAWDPWTQHLYAYCGNNPVNMIDPTGHFWEEISAVLEEIGKVISNYRYAYAGMGAGTLADGPLPIADIAMGLGAIGLTIDCCVQGINNYSQTRTDGSSALKEEAADTPNLQLYKPQTPKNPKPCPAPVPVPVPRADQDDRRYDLHHIVAQYSPHAQPARDILDTVNIDYRRDSVNLVAVPTDFHRIMHTASYFTYVNKSLITVADIYPIIPGNQASYDRRKTAITGCLNSLAKEIQYRAYTGDRWPGVPDITVFD